MAIATGRTASVAVNGSTDWVRLIRGQCRVTVSSDSWGGTTTAALEYSPDASTVIPIDNGSVATVFTKNAVRDIDGPGFVRVTVANIDDPVVIAFTHPLDIE